VTLISLLLVALFFAIGWKWDGKYRLLLSPFMLFSAYFILRVVPGYLVGIKIYDVGSYHALMLPVAYFGFFMGYFTGGKSPYSFVLSSRDSASKMDSKADHRSALVFIVILAVAGLLMYGGIPPAIDVAISLASNSLDAQDAAGIVSDARRSISKGHIFGGESSGSGVFREIIFCCAILSISFSSVRYFFDRKFPSLVILLVSISISYIYVSGDGTRGRFVVVMTTLMIAFSSIFKVKLRHVVYGFIFILSLSVLLGLYTNKMANLFYEGRWDEIVMMVFERVFVGNSINDVVAIRAIESGVFEYGYGYWLLRDILATVPGLSIDKPLAYYLYVFEIGGGSTTYLTGTSLSRAFVDGGYAGVLVYFSILGLISRHLWKIALSVSWLSSYQKYCFVISLWVAIGQGYVSGIAGVFFIAAMLLVLVHFLRGLNVGFRKT